MTPEEQREFVEQCEKKFANRYTDEDPEYKRVAATVRNGGTAPPMLPPREQHFNRDRHHDHHRGGDRGDYRSRDYQRRDDRYDHQRHGGYHDRDRNEHRHHHHRY